MLTQRKRQLIVLLILFSLYGCSSVGPMVRPDPYNPTRTVAVLPMYNVTNSLDGAEYVRKRFAKELANYQYDVMGIARVNSILQEQTGISLGSQLEMTTPQVIGEILDVDALVYGYLLDFDNVILGIYNARIVRAGFKMVDVDTGRVLWSDGKGVKFVLFSGGVGLLATIGKEVVDAGGGFDDFETVKGLEDISGLTDWIVIPVAVENAGDAAILTLGALVVGKTLGVHLHHEANVMVGELIRSMPPGPGP